MKYGKIVEGKFIDRPNRFIAHVEIAGKAETVHVKNTGRRRLLTALLILIPSRGYWFFESFPKRRTPGVCGAMSKMFVGGC